MFGFTRAKPDVTWKAIDGDFLLGVCSRRIFGYASRNVEGSWSAFDDEARPLGMFADLAHAKTALWQAHRAGHAAACAAPSGGWPRRAERAARPSGADPSRGVTPEPASW